ncbi:KUP/HAK/KT family potassium transporter [Lactobacillus crispatus]|jgi:probable potassium transport system protein kup 1|uniref:KUP/HAK/KT family potassium transporter n=1 Tax=Lactobacillus crispatus TaxID=47770 RepID=UPI000760FD05|nr:KUP/HAK/KT family potassium transporter [Lactobacillus crispatus]KWU11229.1 potassium transporter Kup [Lactobacillus crispatus]MBO4166594.1 KUP/HAK/KT family potassium transporter [Lactobacillus crispatus]MCT7754101.1 KUP/HAK/KT family potassium transporter [Lactobacillus crispatus]MCZ3592803.1 KUP/HAK/KT family potassium transporter [Lactobacillus crispatus]MCZ3601471.1 KUP/HAK/KT family potassium transporter [Lactobacillus crispatus]
MNNKAKRMSAAGLLIAIGIVYGDIGTSPLYVMKSIVEGNGGIGNVNRDFIIGSISLVLWTVTLLTTLQTVIIALKATNHGEGGIFALYTLVRKRAKWLVLPALIGGAAILADGTLTPAVTVTTAIEGLKGLNFGGNVPVSTQNMVIAITVVILLVLFSIQKMGTSIIGKAFGPIMFLWFTFLGVMGVMNMVGDWSILQAINPIYAIRLLVSPYNKAGIFILGSIFLATTGAEALYSDVGHVGKSNIIGSWPFVFVCLSLNYFGQGVWILNNPTYRPADGGVLNPFFEMIPANIRLFAIILATIAAVIASQALITGSFTLVAEASGLKFLPRMNINYPSNEKGQIYIPSINKGICVATIAIVLYFQTSAHMEAAYGLSITISMLMTTILLYEWLVMKKVNTVWNWIFLIFFGVLDIMFMISSLTKFTHGGYVSLFIAGAIGFVMYVWYYGNKVRDKREARNAYVRLDEYTDMLTNLSHDENYPTYATNLVYMANVKYNKFIKREILYSILDKRPKRAKAYWFVTVNVTNEPFTAEYAVNTYGTKNVINIQLYLGFKKQTSVNVYIRQIVHDLIADGTIEPQPQEYTTSPGRDVGDFSFVIVNDVISPQTQLVGYEKWLVEARVRLQNLSSNPASWFGLEYADTVIERVPLILGRPNPSYIKRIKPKDYSTAKTK